jgi:exodeoxyribonuclease-3
MFENLSDKLSGTFDRLRGRGRLDEADVAEALREVRLAMLDADVALPDDALFRPEVRQAFRRVVEQGWTDPLRVLHPGERIYTFRDYFRNAWARDAGLRIDHLLLSPALAGRLVGANVDREVRGWEKAAPFSALSHSAVCETPDRAVRKCQRARRVHAEGVIGTDADRTGASLGIGVPDIVDFQRKPGPWRRA